MTEFVHLHVHSQYSMLDSALRLKALVGQAKAMQMDAIWRGTRIPPDSGQVGAEDGQDIQYRNSLRLRLDDRRVVGGRVACDALGRRRGHSQPRPGASSARYGEMFSG
jgi:hypothetical protein